MEFMCCFEEIDCIAAFQGNSTDNTGGLVFTNKCNRTSDARLRVWMRVQTMLIFDELTVFD